MKYHSHVGVPKIIQKGFTYDGKQVYCYDIDEDKLFSTNIDRLGTKRNYYEYEVENKLLAQDVEKELGAFYCDYCNASLVKLARIDEMDSILQTNFVLVQEFFSFMYTRSRKVHQIINGVYSELSNNKNIDELSHSELLKINKDVLIKPNGLTRSKYIMTTILNYSSADFIDNSIGFAISGNGDNVSVLIALNACVAIYLTHDKNKHNIIENTTEVIALYNKSLCDTELMTGNGFIFGKNEEQVKIYEDYIKDKKNSIPQ